MSVNLTVPHFLQLDDGYCLPACVQMTLAYWGSQRSQQQIAKRLKTIPRAGTPGSRLLWLASRRLTITYQIGEISDLLIALDAGIPPIVLVHTSELPDWQIDTAHAVVLTGYDDNEFLLNDPALPNAPIVVSRGDIYLAWDEMLNYYALLQRK